VGDGVGRHRVGSSGAVPHRRACGLVRTLSVQQTKPHPLRAAGLLWTPASARVWSAPYPEGMIPRYAPPPRRTCAALACRWSRTCARSRVARASPSCRRRARSRPRRRRCPTPVLGWRRSQRPLSPFCPHQRLTKLRTHAHTHAHTRPQPRPRSRTDTSPRTRSHGAAAPRTNKRSCIGAAMPPMIVATIGRAFVDTCARESLVGILPGGYDTTLRAAVTADVRRSGL
jgi:hypothetical protein